MSGVEKKKPLGPGGGQGVNLSVVRTNRTAQANLNSSSFGELQLLVGAGAPDAAGAGASVVVIDEPTVRGRSGQGAVAVGHGQQRVDRVRRR